MNAAPPRRISRCILLRLPRSVGTPWALVVAHAHGVSLHTVRRRFDRLFDLVVDRILEPLRAARGPAEPAVQTSGIAGRRKVAQIERLAHGDVEEAGRVRGNGQVGERLDLVQRKPASAGQGLAVGVGSIVVEVADSPGGDGASDGAGNIKVLAWENGEMVVEPLWMGSHKVVSVRVAVHDSSHTAGGVADSEYTHLIVVLQLGFAPVQFSVLEANKRGRRKQRDTHQR